MVTMVPSPGRFRLLAMMARLMCTYGLQSGQGRPSGSMTAEGAPAHAQARPQPSGTGIRRGPWGLPEGPAWHTHESSTHGSRGSAAGPPPCLRSAWQTRPLSWGCRRGDSGGAVQPPRTRDRLGCCRDQPPAVAAAGTVLLCCKRKA